MKIINLTPHPINIINESNSLEIMSSGILVRCDEQTNYLFELELDNNTSVPVYNTSLKSNIDNLPCEESDVFYIVSIITAALFPNRKDFLVPHEYVRDNEGNIIGCKSFKRISDII